MANTALAWVDDWLIPILILSGIGVVCMLLLLWKSVLLQREHALLGTALDTLQNRIPRLAAYAPHRDLIEQQADPVVARRRDGRIEIANEAFARLVGRPLPEIIGSRAAPVVTEAGTARLRPDGARLVDEAIGTDHGIRWFSWAETEIIGADGVLLLRVGREMTERVSSERALDEARIKAEAANEAKSRFLATVSHEFRTPLNGILGMSDLLLETGLDPEQTTYTEAIRSSAAVFLSLIDEILDFSKIEAGRLDLVSEPVDLVHLVEGVVELLAPRAQGKDIEIASFVAQDVPLHVTGDRDRLRQVLVNLAGNAVKFTESGGVGVSLVRAPDGGIVFAVEDTGPGIAPDRLARIFDEFEQGDGSASQRHGGTGLGLAITKSLVGLMQGEITVDSEPGRGSRFQVHLPLEPLPGAATRPAPPSSLVGLRALVLAEAPFEARFLVRRLAEAGAVAQLATQPGEAKAAIASSHFDLLVADCALGEEAIREVAVAAAAAGIQRRIVLLSPFERRGLGSPQASGFDAFLMKPVRARSLFERLSLHPPVPTSLAPAPAAAAIEAPRPKRARVLLAEDNDINALLAMKALERLGAMVERARDGDEALAMASEALNGARQAYDLILMDIRMPGLDGCEVTRRIRAAEKALPGGPRCRIVAVTANTLKEDEAAARQAGVDGFLPKPFTVASLAALLAAPADLAAAAS